MSIGTVRTVDAVGTIQAVGSDLDHLSLVRRRLGSCILVRAGALRHFVVFWGTMNSARKDLKGMIESVRTSHDR
jgi:hypothetical protein